MGSARLDRAGGPGEEGLSPHANTITNILIMKTLISFTGAIALAVGLTACGGGGTAAPDTVLAIDDGQPEAYTTAYLDQHPEMLVQPEHLIVAELDPTGHSSDASVRLYVREDTAVSIDSDDRSAAVAGIDIVDEHGRTPLRHLRGIGAAQAVLAAGKYRVVFHPAPAGAGVDTSRHLAYLKLADTSTQALKRTQRDQVSTLLASQTSGAALLEQHPLGVGSTDQCIACSFDGADLAGHDFSGQDLAQSTFDAANLNNARFTGADCTACKFTHLRMDNDTYTGFDRANLATATFQGVFTKVSFRGAHLESALVQQDTTFNACDFGPAADGTTTSLRNADLSGAFFLDWGADGGIRGADFTGAKGRPGMFGRMNLEGETSTMVGAHFVNMTPANLFAAFNFRGMDLSGVDFTGMDLSHVDFSTANNVTLAADTDFWDATLSDGTTGIKLAGHDFGNGFARFAGKFDGTTPG
jgi:uncharacterized protein YjbI with pentapeptide repeats